MSESILTSIKKNLGLAESYEAFDADIILFINSSIANLTQLGVGLDAGFQIVDKTATWESFLGTDPRLNNIKTFIYLKVRLLFDPPATSFAIEAFENQAKELEWRISVHREDTEWVAPVAPSS